MKPKRSVVGLNPFCEFGKFFILNIVSPVRTTRIRGNLEQ
jgi:hypothetical protein